MARQQLLEVQERTPWHKSETGCWSLSLGERGCRVRVAQREPGGTFFRVTWIPGQGRSQASLLTSSRPVARARAEAFFRALTETEHPQPAAPLTLEGLWNRYQQGAPRYRKNSPRTRAGKARVVQFLYAGLGRSKAVEHLCLNDVEQYVERREHGLALEDGTSLGPAGARAVEGDLQLLRTMLNWATTVKDNGRWLLQENPLRGMQLPHETSPRRAVATYDRFEKTIAAVQQLTAKAISRPAKQKWMRIELALVIAEAMGARLGSIRGLKWADWDFDRPAVRWNREFDKRKYDRVVPVPQALAERVKALRLRLEAFGDGWLFPNQARGRALAARGVRSGTQARGARGWAPQTGRLPLARVPAQVGD